MFRLRKVGKSPMPPRDADALGKDYDAAAKLVWEVLRRKAKEPYTVIPYPGGRELAGWKVVGSLPGIIREIYPARNDKHAAAVNQAIRMRLFKHDAIAVMGRVGEGVVYWVRDEWTDNEPNPMATSDFRNDCLHEKPPYGIRIQQAEPVQQEPSIAVPPADSDAIPLADSDAVPPEPSISGTEATQETPMSGSTATVTIDEGVMVVDGLSTIAMSRYPLGMDDEVLAELDAMREVWQILTKLPSENVRERVLAWVNDRLSSVNVS